MIVENQEGGLQGSDIQGLSADLLEAARRRNLSANTLAAYERTWTRFLAWAAAAGFAREEIMAWCEDNGVYYCLGLARNKRLSARLGKWLRRASQGDPVWRDPSALPAL